MKKLLLITLTIFALSAGYGFAHESGGMMGGAMHQDSTQTGSSSAAPGYGGHMTGSGMMGSGGHMMGKGTKGSGGCGMMSSGMMGHMGGMTGSGMMQGMMGSDMMGLGMMGYGSEEEYSKILDKTVDLRREMHNKMFELREALRSQDTNLDTILKLKKEMLEIKVKIYERALKR